MAKTVAEALENSDLMTQDAVQGKLDALETKIERTIEDAVDRHTDAHHGKDGSDGDANLQERVAVVESALKTHTVLPGKPPAERALK